MMDRLLHLTSKTENSNLISSKYILTIDVKTENNLTSRDNIGALE
jgi:hypothetical protein